ncbi:hydrogenase maturation nickel metallochaperone HypA [Clostridium folliculivorans]|uniref:Hydrogenase maturation factor HypA n=1 Tax=Clostridium folliculivorans TaxID=2886038 RepID=A0A9W6DBP1_9CLOT|nr:hydrogenase maturation nickel metallochaperone HypA [Clostridium folliculivorans]GKU25908.1 putative hydrogenase nickel incorporation protein HypA [Clostridium folliculivorans]GKU27994.1 putative hydrogenase nickel incorporation protein HypA [Clostridium folliculivorans]
MHEISIIQEVMNITQKTAAENNMKRVDKITLKIGELSGVMIDPLVFAFSIIRQGTLAETSKLEVIKVDARAKCDTCNTIFKIDYSNKLCPACNKFSNNIISGYELNIETIEGE